ncbi:Uncharacterised protein [Acinetobacter baumannii]|nr:Uncharacterised protein [Acinetobacter baumannii]
MTFGTIKAANTPKITITTITSISVKPEARFIRARLEHVASPKALEEQTSDTELCSEWHVGSN